MAARAMGSATLSFGLVSIPIKLFSSNAPEQSIHFNLLHGECGTRLKQQYICPKDNVVVERSAMAKGYEFAKGQYVLFSDEEIKALEEAASGSIEIREFVPAAKVDPIYFEKAYYLGPDKGGEKAYALLGAAMLKTGHSALAKYAARGKDYLVLVRAIEGGLVLQQLRHANEVRSFSEIPVERADVKEGELKLAIQVIEQITTKTFSPQNYADSVYERMQDAIKRKVDGKEITVAPQEAPQAQIVDLMEALKASLGVSPKQSANDSTEAVPKPAKRVSRGGAEAKEVPAPKKKTKRA